MKTRKILAIVLALALVLGSVTVYALNSKSSFLADLLKPDTNTAEDAGAGDAPLRIEAVGKKFEEKDTTVVTWINIWYASSESWFRPDSADGIRYYINGTWTGMDWDDPAFARAMLTQMKEAGVDVIVFDLTNGLTSWIMTRSHWVTEICAELGLKFCVAVGNADDAGLNQRASVIMAQFAGASAAMKDIYYHKNGKPVLVNYITEGQWNRISQDSSLTSYHQFTNVWASGGEAGIDKWGWQLDPAVGVVPSEDTMFVSGSLFWNSELSGWCKSLAWLDYNMLLASKSQPETLVLGSYDDVSERNGWGFQDTTNADKGEAAFQKDIYGNLTVDGWHSRVTSWLSEEGPTVVSGGTLMDGAYKMVNVHSGLLLNTDMLSYTDGISLQQLSPMEDTSDYVWLYHVGNDNYRIVRLSAGKSLAVAEDGMEVGDNLIQEYDTYTDRQFWKLVVNEDGSYTFINNANGLVIGVNKNSTSDGAYLKMQEANGSDSQKWTMEPVLLMK